MKRTILMIHSRRFLKGKL